MERKLIIILSIFIIGTKAFCEQNYVVKPVSAVSNTTQTLQVNSSNTNPQNVSPTIPQMISFEKCTNKYNVAVDKLYFLTLASINANNFIIKEIQSKNGYILFNAANREFLASVHRVDNNSAILKIVPADNNYYFPLGILTNIYKYIDLNITTQIDELG